MQRSCQSIMPRTLTRQTKTNEVNILYESTIIPVTVVPFKSFLQIIIIIFFFFFFFSFDRVEQPFTIQCVPFV